jgi:TPR repeat protein
MFLRENKTRRSQKQMQLGGFFSSRRERESHPFRHLCSAAEARTFLTVFCLSVLGCAHHAKWQTSHDKFELTKREFRVLSTQADAGNAQAAFRIAEYYLYSCPDFEQIVFWCKKSAQLGHPYAKKLLPGLMFRVRQAERARSRSSSFAPEEK